MNQTGTTFDAIAIGLAFLGVLVAGAIHVVHPHRDGMRRLLAIAGDGADARRAGPRKGGQRNALPLIAGALFVAAAIAILAYAFARKFHLI